MAYNDPLNIIATIDARIDSRLSRITAMGEVQTVNPNGREATVTMYGGAQAIPVKRAGHVDCNPGDKVGLVKAERDWWIAWSAPRRDAPASLHTFLGGSSATPDTTALATYVTLPTAPTFALTKRYDATYIEADARMGAYATSLSAKVGTAVLVNGVDYDLATYMINTVSDHKHFTAIAVIMSALPAGLYTVAYRWKRVSGSGTLNINNDDFWSVRYTERWP